HENSSEGERRGHRKAASRRERRNFSNLERLKQTAKSAVIPCMCRTIWQTQPTPKQPWLRWNMLAPRWSSFYPQKSYVSQAVKSNARSLSKSKTVLKLRQCWNVLKSVSTSMHKSTKLGACC